MNIFRRGDDGPVVLVGPLIHLETGERAHVMGVWVTDSRYGDQVQVTRQTEFGDEVFGSSRTAQARLGGWPVAARGGRPRRHRQAPMTGETLRRAFRGNRWVIGGG